MCSEDCSDRSEKHADCDAHDRMYQLMCSCEVNPLITAICKYLVLPDWQFIFDSIDERTARMSTVGFGRRGIGISGSNETAGRRQRAKHERHRHRQRARFWKSKKRLSKNERTPTRGCQTGAPRAGRRGISPSHFGLRSCVGRTSMAGWNTPSPRNERCRRGEEVGCWGIIAFRH